MVRAVLSTAALILAAGLSHTGKATAQPADTSSAAVAYGDLDPSTDKGAERLYLRLVHAAQELCRSELSPADIDGPQRYHACTDDAVARAVADVRSAKLSEVYARESGGPHPVQTAAAQ